jgi:hypothetical protein
VKNFLILGDFGARVPGLFVAEDEEAALDMLARRFGYANAEEAAAAEPAQGRHRRAWRERYRVWPAVDRDEPRTVRTDISAILDVIMLTEEEQGTTGHLVRLGLYKMAGKITLADIRTWLAAYTNDSEDEEELAHFLNKILPLVEAARLAVLGEALKAVGLDKLGHDVEFVEGEAVPAQIERVQAELARRRARTTDHAALTYLTAAEKAAKDVLEGRKGVTGR